MDFHSDEELVGAALFGATDLEARAIVEQLLGAAGIDCFIVGSVVFSVQVTLLTSTLCGGSVTDSNNV